MIGREMGVPLCHGQARVTQYFLERLEVPTPHHGRERETCHGQLRKPCCPQVLSGKVLCSTRSGSCLFPASCEPAVFRSASAAKRSIWGSHASPAPTVLSGVASPGSRESQDVARPVVRLYQCRRALASDLPRVSAMADRE